jgi:DNA-binding CsgD family transcriptional regulator
MDLVYAICRVHDGARWIAPEAAAQLAENSPRVPLTSRELEVLRLVAGGNRNKEIAGTLGVTEDTVKFHVKSILGKLGVNDRTHAVTVAVIRIASPEFTASIKAINSLPMGVWGIRGSSIVFALFCASEWQPVPSTNKPIKQKCASTLLCFDMFFS